MAKQKKETVKNKYLALCMRCQRRIDAIETGHPFRYECGATNCNVTSCYAYVPIKPLVITKNKDDKRVLFGPAMLSCRAHSAKEADCELNLKWEKKGRSGVIYWVPKGERQ